MAPCCALFGSKKVEELTAYEQGMQGIEEMLAGYAKVATLALPPGAALVLSSVRKNLTQMQSMLNEASFAEARFWRAPLLSEQNEWVTAYPQGGILLRRQLCIASLGDDDYSLGGLFLSDVGLAFDTGNVPEGRVESGFICWKDVEKFTRPAAANSLVLSVVGNPNFSELRLQLTITADAEWFEGFVESVIGDVVVEEGTARSKAVAFKDQVSTSSISTQQDGPKVLLTQLSSCSSIATEGSKQPDAWITRAEHRAITLASRLSGEYAEAPGGRQAFHIPEGDKPLAVEKLPSAIIATISAKLSHDNWLTSFLKENKLARDICATPWAECTRAPGVMVRKATFTVSVPQDFPRAVTKLVQLPKETKVTAIFRLLLSQEDDLIFTAQICSHDIPYGDNFRVHETARFRPTGSTGVEATNWVEVMWIADLPWTHGALKSIIDQRTKSKNESLMCRVVGALKKE